MNITTRRILTRLSLVACLALPFSACKKEEAPKEVEAAAVTAPTTTDKAAWQAYIVDVAKRNMDGVNASPFAYFLPAESSPEFAAEYDRLLEKVEDDVGRGIIEGNMLVFGSPSPAKMADLIVTAFTPIKPNAMKGVKVVYVGTPADAERVKAGLATAGVDYVFVEAK
ncbi:MAG: hypothetical protein WKF61_10040 [Luteimonas sp.]